MRLGGSLNQTLLLVFLQCTNFVTDFASLDPHKLIE